MKSEAALSRRSGVTLIEVMVSIVIFAIAIMVTGRFIVQFIGQTGVSEAEAQATEFALEELERVKLLPYDEIVDRGPEAVPEAPGYTREVTVRSVGDSATSVYMYRMVTVTVDPPGELQPVKLTSAVAP